MSDKLRDFLDRVHNVSAGEAADKMFDRIFQGIGVFSAIYFLFHKLSQAKISTISNEDLVGTLVSNFWSDSTTEPIINELAKRRHFFAWYMIFLSGVDIKGLRKRALREMKELAHSADEVAIVAACSHPLLSKPFRDRSKEICDRFFDDFLMLPDN